jgi:CheY-like chemotaxis protein
MTGDRLVLVVDDDVDVRETVADVLESAGYRVATAYNGRHALHLLKVEKVRPDVILLDMMMPELDGWGFRAEQRKDPELAPIPVVVFTAFGVPAETAAQLAAAGFLKKPPRIEDLLSTLARACGGRSPLP